MQDHETPVNSITYKLKQIRNRFYEAGDDGGVLLCENLAEDLNIDIKTKQQDEDK